MSSILIVGGAGYIGSHVNHALLDAGYQTIVYDNLSTGLQSNVPKESTFIRGDILSKQALQNVFSEHSIKGVIHLAALKAAGESMETPNAYANNNIVGTLNLIQACLEGGTSHLVFSSTAAVYGEPQYLPLDEKHPTKPENFYGYTKLNIEDLLNWYGRLKGLQFASLRYFNAAGYDPQGRVTGLEQDPQNLLPIVMEAAIGTRPSFSVFGTDYPTPDGTCIRDYIHVSDLANAHILALKKIMDTQKSLCVNLGTGQGTSVMEVVQTAEKICGKAIPHQLVGRRSGDPSSLYANSDKAQELLGWKPKYSSMEQLIQTTWDVYLKNKS
jgi:UDP-glucose 4-epimerase